MDKHYEHALGTLTGTFAELMKTESDENSDRIYWNGEGTVELARGIEPPTGGLQNRCSAD